MAGVAAHRFHVLAHAEQERVERVAAGGEQAAAAGLAFRVPSELPVPGPDAVIVIDFAVMNPPQQAAVDDGFDGQELTGITSLEADARLDAGVLHGFLDRQAIVPFQRERLFDDKMLAGLGGGDSVPGVVLWVAAD